MLLDKIRQTHQDLALRPWKMTAEELIVRRDFNNKFLLLTQQFNQAATRYINGPERETIIEQFSKACSAYTRLINEADWETRTTHSQEVSIITGLYIDLILNPCGLVHGEKVTACHNALNNLTMGINDMRDTRSIEEIQSILDATLVMMESQSSIK